MDTCEHAAVPQESYEKFMADKYWSKNRPANIHFELTRRCNLRCIHCLFSHGRGDELSTKEVFSVLTQIAKSGVLNLSLSGGEIFTRRDIADILDFLRTERFVVSIYTNGTLLNASHIDRIAALNPADIQISVYGATPEVHDAVTGSQGSFQKTINCIRECSEARLPVIFKGFLLKKNFHQRWDMIELAEKSGVLYYSFDFNMIPGENGDIANLSAGLSAEQVETVYSEVAEKGLVLRNNVRIKSRDSQLPKGGNVVCNPGRINGCISACGDVYPCPVLRLSIGNVREKPFAEIWGTDMIDPIRYMKPADLKECRACPVISSCNRCPGVAYLETGDYLGPAPFSVCNMYKSLSQGEKEGDDVEEIS